MLQLLFLIERYVPLFVLVWNQTLMTSVVMISLRPPACSCCCRKFAYRSAPLPRLSRSPRFRDRPFHGAISYKNLDEFKTNVDLFLVFDLLLLLIFDLPLLALTYN